MSDQRLPEHRNPFYSDDARLSREAFAPYNFVPLPDRVVEAPTLSETQWANPELAQLVRRDVYHQGRHTGQIVCELRTESPLYVRCALTEGRFAEADRMRGADVEQDYRTLPKNTPEFFYTSDPLQPVIPGSSLRGMLRSLVEIASYANIERVTDRSLFFRTVDDTSIGRAYRGRMGDGKVHGGWLTVTGRTANIESCRVYKVNRDQLVPNGGDPDILLYGSDQQRPKSPTNPSRTPDWARQYQTVWIKGRDYSTGFGRADDVRLQRPAEQGWIEGTLVITGGMQGKKHEFVFVREPHPATYKVEEETLSRFHNDDQLSLWQRKAFPPRQPRGADRARKGTLDRANPQPVFFITDDEPEGQVEFFGRAQMFRLPYTRSPHDLVPRQLRDERLDLTQVIFGFVPQQPDDLRPVIAGRVSVSDGVLVSHEGPLWLVDPNSPPVTPRILSGPKPTCFQHYLVQAHDQKDELAHYDSDATTIRGHKLYWRHIGVGAGDLTGGTGDIDSQRTQFRPVAAGVRFQFTIGFENLTAEELGALLWVLRLCDSAAQGDKEYRLALGMGKPLGMGSVKVTIGELTAHRPAERYGTLVDEVGWVTGAAPLDAEACVAKFEQYVLAQSGEGERYGRLAETLRLRCLLSLLSWPGPERGAIGYMQVQTQTPRVGRDKRNEYKDRPVLPRPLRVAGEEPPGERAGRTQGGPPSSPVGLRSPQGPPRGLVSRPVSEPVRLEKSPPAKIEPKLPAVGEPFTGLVLERDADIVLIEVPGFDRQKAIALLKVDQATPRWRPKKDKASVEVIGVRERDGLTVLRVKWNPKPKGDQP